MSLEDRLALIRAEARNTIPSRLQDVIEKELKTLIQTGQAERGKRSAFP